MRILEYRGNKPHAVWHSLKLARMSMGDKADIREVHDDHTDIRTLSDRVVAERRSRVSRQDQVKALIPKLKEGTASMAQVQKVLAHLLGD